MYSFASRYKGTNGNANSKCVTLKDILVVLSIGINSKEDRQKKTWMTDEILGRTERTQKVIRHSKEYMTLQKEIRYIWRHVKEKSINENLHKWKE